jgi:hypothetical protein
MSDEREKWEAGRRAGYEDVARWHDMRRDMTLDEQQAAFHEACAGAIRMFEPRPSVDREAAVEAMARAIASVNRAEPPDDGDREAAGYALDALTALGWPVGERGDAHPTPGGADAE